LIKHRIILEYQRLLVHGVVVKRALCPITLEERGSRKHSPLSPVLRNGVIGNEIDDIFSFNSRIFVNRLIGVGRKHLHDFPTGPVRIDYPFDSGSGSSNGRFREKAYGFSPVSNAI
jgi:hypothetical protein